MIVQIRTKKFNPSKLGRAWIAVVDFSKDDFKEQYSWGKWTGSYQTGSAGILTVNAEAGDILATSQKEIHGSRSDMLRNRHPRSEKIKPRVPEFFLVLVNGHTQSLGDRATALAYYLDNKKSDELLLAERNILLARIDEIDMLMGAGGHRLTRRLDG